MAALNSFSYICTRALHAFRSFAHCRAASTVTPLLPKATFTPSIQPNLRLPRTRPPLTSAINTLLAIRYSSILSICPNHLNTLWSALLANSLSIPALISYDLFIPNSIHSRHSNQTSQTLHLKNIPFPSLHLNFLKFTMLWSSHETNGSWHSKSYTVKIIPLYNKIWTTNLVRNLIPIFGY